MVPAANRTSCENANVGEKEQSTAENRAKETGLNVKPVDVRKKGFLVNCESTASGPVKVDKPGSKKLHRGEVSLRRCTKETLVPTRRLSSLLASCAFI